MDFSGIVDAIDQQLALLWEVRDLLDAKPEDGTLAFGGEAAKTKAKRIERSKKQKASSSAFQGALELDRGKPHSLFPDTQIFTSIEESKRNARSKGSATPSRNDRPPCSAQRISSSLKQLPRALTNEIPSGPVVVKASLLAQNREAKGHEDQPTSSPKGIQFKSALDELIEAAAARSRSHSRQLA